MKHFIFKGMATAMVTPMTATGVDYDALARLIDFQLEKGRHHRRKRDIDPRGAQSRHSVYRPSGKRQRSCHRRYRHQQYRACSGLYPQRL